MYSEKTARLSSVLFTCCYQSCTFLCTGQSGILSGYTGKAGGGGGGGGGGYRYLRTGIITVPTTSPIINAVAHCSALVLDAYLHHSDFFLTSFYLPTAFSCCFFLLFFSFFFLLLLLLLLLSSFFPPSFFLLHLRPQVISQVYPCVRCG